MGFLQKIFKSKEILYLETLVKELKEDKEQLKQEKVRLLSEIDSINKSKRELEDFIKNMTPTIKENKSRSLKLTKKEQLLLNLLKTLGIEEKKQICNKLNIKESSFKVYLYRLKDKGHDYLEKN